MVSGGVWLPTLFGARPSYHIASFRGVDGLEGVSGVLALPAVTWSARRLVWRLACVPFGSRPCCLHPYLVALAVACTCVLVTLVPLSYLPCLLVLWAYVLLILCPRACCVWDLGRWSALRWCVASTSLLLVCVPHTILLSTLTAYKVYRGCRAAAWFSQRLLGRRARWYGGSLVSLLALALLVCTLCACGGWCDVQAWAYLLATRHTWTRCCCMCFVVWCAFCVFSRCASCFGALVLLLLSHTFLVSW